MTALCMNPGRFLGENRKKIARVLGEAHCTALVQCPRDCGGRLVNGSEFSALLDLARPETGETMAPGQ